MCYHLVFVTNEPKIHRSIIRHSKYIEFHSHKFVDTWVFLRIYVHIVHSGRDLFDLFRWIDCRLMNIVTCIWWIAQIFQEDREAYSIPKRKSRKMLTRCFARKTGVTSKKILAAHLLSVLPATYCTSQCNLTSVYQILSPKFFQKKPLLAFPKKILPFNTQSFERKLVINRIFSFDE